MQTTEINMKKRGDMIMPTIITVVGIALFLVIIVLLFGRIPWFSTIDREACQNSILQRATFNLGPFEVGKTAIPLKCKTEKVCLAESGGDCEIFPESTKKNPVTEIEISSGENARIAVMDQIADSMYDCHKMLGEGKINFMPLSTWEKNYCLVCARLAFDDQVKQDVQKIPYGALYRHLQQKKDLDGKSYLSFIYPGWESWEVSKTLFEEIQKQNPDFENMKFEDWAIDLSQENGYAIIAQMQTEGRWVQYGASIGVAGVVVGASVAAVFTGGLSLAAIPVAIGIASTGVGGGLIAGGVTYWITNPDGYKYSPPTIYPYDIPTLQSLDCSSFETAP